MLKKSAMLCVGLSLASPSLVFAQAPVGGATRDAASDHPSESDDGGWFGSVKGMFGHGEDHSCATQATTTNAAGDTIYIKRPNCP